jgi:hypothetical protein
MADQGVGVVTGKLSLDTQQFDSKINASTVAMDKALQAQERAAQRTSKVIEISAKVGADAVTKNQAIAIRAIAAETDARKTLAQARGVARGQDLSEAEGANLVGAAHLKVAAAARERAQAIERLNHVEHTGFGNRAAASAVVRGIETGNPGIRAVEATLTRLVGSGVLNAAFSVIGPIAFAAAVVKGGMALYELEQKGVHAGAEISRAWGELDTRLAASNDELALSLSKVNDENAKMEGHPRNGLETALLEAKVAADKLQESLAADVKTLGTLLQQHSIGTLEGLVSNVAGTKFAETDIKADAAGLEDRNQNARDALDRQLLTVQQVHQKSLAEAKGNQKLMQAADDAAYAASDTAQRNFNAQMATNARMFAGIQRERANAVRKRVVQEKADAEQVNNQSVDSYQVSVADHSGEISDYEGAAKVGDRLAVRADMSGALLTANETHGKLEAAKEGKEGSNKAAEEARKAAELRMKSMEAYVAEWRTQAPVSAKAVYDYWEVQKATFAAGSQQFQQIVEKQASIAEEGARRVSEIFAKRKEEDKRYAEEAERAMMSAAKVPGLFADDRQKTQTATAEAAARVELSNARGQALMDEARLSTEAGKSVTRLDAARQLAAIHAKEYAAEIAALNDKLQATKGGKYEDDAARIRAVSGVQDEMSQLGQRRGVQVLQDQAANGFPDSSALVGAKDALAEFTRIALDSAGQMKSVINSALNDINHKIVEDLTTRHRGDHHQVREIGHDLATKATGALVERGEGSVLKMLGVGSNKAPKGTASDPLHVVMAGAGANANGLPDGFWNKMPSVVPGLGGTGSGGSDAGGGSSATGLGSLLNMGGSGGTGGFASILKLAAGSVIPGFATGVSNFGGGWAMTGEQGPELLKLPSGSSVIPSRKTAEMMGGGGGGHTVYVDARGSTDPAQIEAAAHRAVVRALPGTVKAARSYSADQDRRKVGR